MRPGRWNLEEFPTGTEGFRKMSRPVSFFESFPLRALQGTNIFTIIAISRQNTSGLSIYLIVLNFLKIWDNATGNVELGIIPDRYVGI
jgi:hypothetical protein